MADNSKPKSKLDIEALLGQVVALLARHDPKTLTFSQISRLTGVARPTL